MTRFLGGSGNGGCVRRTFRLNGALTYVLHQNQGDPTGALW